MPEPIHTVSELLLNIAVGGQQGNQDTHLVPPHAFVRGLNVITRNGHCQSRYGFLTRIFTEIGTGDWTEFIRGKFQGAELYQSETSLWLMAMVSGRLYKLDMAGYTIECLSNKTDDNGKEFALNEDVDRCTFCQAERYFIVQDGLNPGIILDGDSLSWAHPQGTNDGTDYITVPIGQIMAYGHGRLFIQVTPTSFLAGDIWKADSPGDCLKFTETDYLDQGGALGFPANLGNMVGMQFIKNITSGDGMGELTVFGEYGAAGYQVQLPRSAWQTNDICKVLITEHGLTAPQGLVSVNQDLVYQSADGIRSLKLNMTEASSLWYGMLGTRVLSMDVQNYTQLETPWLQKFISGCQWDNRLLMTSGGMLLMAENLNGDTVLDYGFTGLLSLDFMNVSDIDQKLKPTWDGLWSRYSTLQVLSATYRGANRCFVLSKTPDYRICLLEIDKQAVSDGADPIYSQVATRGVTFSDPQAGRDDALKQIKLVEGWLQELIGDVYVTLYFKTDDYPVWLPCGQRYFCAPDGGVDYPSSPWLQQARTRVSFESPPIYVNPTGGLLNSGYIFELLICWTGHAKVEKLRLKATVDPQVPEAVRPETCQTVNGLLPQIQDAGSAFTDPSHMVSLVAAFADLATTPWDYPSNFGTPRRGLYQLKQNWAGTNPDDGSLASYKGGAPGQAHPTGVKEYWRWVGEYNVSEGNWIKNNSFTLVVASTAQQNAYAERDPESCGYYLYGPLHYDKRRAITAEDLAPHTGLLPDPKNFDLSTWLVKTAVGGSWATDTSTPDFSITDVSADGKISKKFFVESSTGSPTETTSQRVAYSVGVGPASDFVVEVQLDGETVDMNESEATGTFFVDVTCGQHEITLWVYAIGEGISCQWRATGEWDCGPCNDNMGLATYDDLTTGALKGYRFGHVEKLDAPVPEKAGQAEVADTDAGYQHTVYFYSAVGNYPDAAPAAFLIAIGLGPAGASAQTQPSVILPTDHPCKRVYDVEATLQTGSDPNTEQSEDDLCTNCFTAADADSGTPIGTTIEKGFDEDEPTVEEAIAVMSPLYGLGTDGTGCSPVVGQGASCQKIPSSSVTISSPTCHGTPGA